MKTEKTKTIKRISLFAALAVLICMSLAVSVFADTTSATGVKGDTCYTVGDVNGDGNVSKADAVYLLYHSVFEDGYALKQDGNFNDEDTVITGKDALKLLFNIENNAEFIQEVHAYDDPIWTWNETYNVVTAAYKCACGTKAEIVNATVESTQVDATCTTTGSTTYTATAVYDGVEYTSTKTVALPATGHAFKSELKACDDKECTREGCEYVEKGDAHKVDLNTPTATDVVVNLAKCTYKNQYECSVCNATVDGPEYVKHQYSAKITTEATCQSTGVKTYTCTCGDSYTETIPKNDAHTWGAGVKEGNVTTYTCTAGCEATRTTIDASTEQSAAVSKSDLVKAGEVELKDAAVKLDTATIEELGANVTISATTKNASEITIDSELAAQIKTPIYDFTLTSDNSNVTEFAGNVTVTIPYELQPDDDPDCIDVWYIKDDGKVDVVKGTYSNGYVTFTTNHFSYYTVTRLTPAQRCDAYGHTEKTFEVAATCTTAGYTRTVCLRCGYVVSQTDIVATGHNYVVDEKDATCTEDGYKKSECSACGDKKEVVYKATGHKYTDTNVEATCSTKGYIHYVCSTCDYEEKEYDSTPIGHKYGETWSWDEKNLTATVTLDCTREDCENRVTENAVVSMSKQSAASCADSGETVYTAQIQIENIVYDDVYTVTEAQLSHKLGNEVKYNSFYHYKECSACGARVNEEEHAMDDGEVTAAATCSAAGVMTYSCSCGYTEEEAIPALSHVIVNGKCTNCGFVASTCDHEDFTYEEIELSEDDGYCGAWFYYSTCECGEVVYIDDLYSNCAMEYKTEITKDANGYIKYDIKAICEDCGLQVDIDEWFELEDTCMATCYATYKVYDKNNQLVIDMTGIYYEEYVHPTVVYVSQEDLTQYDLCGGTATITKCPCGECTGVRTTTDCSYYYDETLSASVCEDCGIHQEWDWDEESIGNCQYKYTNTTSFYKGETKLVSYVSTGINTYHENREYSFKLDGTVCSDGFTVTETCKDCEYSDSWEVTPTEGYHPTDYKKLDLSEYDLCNESTYVYACPCGGAVSVGDMGSHNWTWGDYSYEESEDGESYVETEDAKCDDCGLEMSYAFARTKLDEACAYTYEDTTVYSKDGKEIITTHYNNSYYNHSAKMIAARYLGETESCEDGVRVTFECTECGAVETEYYYWHAEFVTASYDANEYGMCDGTIKVTACACGERQGMYLDTACDWEYIGYDYTVGAEIAECQECGIVRQCTYKDEALEGCMIKRIEQYDFVKGQDVVLTIKSTWYSDNHELKYNFVLDNPDGACYDGYTVTQTCKNCDYTYTRHEDARTDTYHSTNYRLETYQMSEFGLCSGEINHMICPCGKEEYYQYAGCGWQQVGYDDETKTESYVCNTCGATREYSYTLGAQVGCECPAYRTYTYFDVDGKQVFTYSYEGVSYNHNYSKTVTLLEGSTSCEDGVLVSGTCDDCGDSYSYNTYWHETGTLQKYDLSEFGSECGAYLTEEECACGEQYYTSLSGNCDFGWNSITPWLGERFDGQCTSDGWRNIDYSAFEIRCAVTDPACDTSLRMCRYYVWDEVACSMQEIQVWQLGYDSSTGKYDKEISIVIDEFAYHDYEVTRTNEGNTYVNTYTCTTCGSTYVETEARDESGRILYFEDKATNALDNGEPLEYVYYDYYEYDATYDYNYNIMWGNRHTYADGSVSYWQAECVYDKVNCTRTVTYSSSEGYSYSFTESYHPVYGQYVQYVQLVSPSCTQVDRWGYESDCPVCTYYVLEGPYENEPWGHGYSYNSETGTYTCYRCGLESANGADGSIVLEDMTSTYGNDTNYVIGYWNKTSINFTYYVSVVSGENEVMLPDVKIKVLSDDVDGINALSINKEEVAAAMTAAGATGDIRVTVVPTGSDGTLDYAITLTE